MIVLTQSGHRGQQGLCVYVHVHKCVWTLGGVNVCGKKRVIFTRIFFLIFLLRTSIFRAVSTHFSWHCLGDFFEGGRKRLRVGLGEGAKG